RLAFLHEGEVLAVDRREALLERCTGCVYELRTADRGRAHNLLVARPEVLGIRHLADRVHFQVESPAALAAGLGDELHRAGDRVEAVAPGLDDAYIMLGGGEKGAAYARSAPQLQLSPRLPERGRIHTQ